MTAAPSPSPSPSRTNNARALAGKVAAFRALLAAPAIQSMTEPLTCKGAQAIMKDCNSHQSIKDFLAETAHVCDQAMAHLSALPELADWQPPAIEPITLSLAQIELELLNEASPSYIPFSLPDLVSNEDAIQELPWTQLFLLKHVAALRLARQDYDPAEKNDAILHALTISVMPDLTSNFSSVAELAANHIRIANENPLATLIVGVNPKGKGVTPLILWRNFQGNRLSSLAGCTRLFQLNGTSWKQITLEQARALT